MPEGAEPEAEDTEAPIPVTDDLPAEVRKHMDRQSRRIDKLQRQLAKSELKQRYGDLVDVIPEGLPTDAWGTLLENIKARMAPPAETTQNAAEIQVEGVGAVAIDTPSIVEMPTPEEQRLAAVASGPSANSTVPGIDQEQLLEIAKTDPNRYLALKKQGYSLAKLPGSAS